MNSHISTSQHRKAGRRQRRAGQGRILGCSTETESDRACQSHSTPSCSWGACCRAGVSWQQRSLAWVATLLLAPGFPAKMRRSRRTRLKLIPLLLALLSVFELELCKTHQHEQLSCESALVSRPYIYGHVNTSISPTLTGVAFVANRTPQPFSTDKHPWGHPDLPEQPQTWQEDQE